MKSVEQLAFDVDQLQRRIVRQRKLNQEIARQSQLLRNTRLRALDLLGADDQGRPLRPAPLIWALVGAVLALVMAFLTYLTWLFLDSHHGVDSDFRYVVPLLVICPLCGGLSLVFSRRPGAGGSARALLRPLTVGLFGFCLALLGVVALVTIW